MRAKEEQAKIADFEKANLGEGAYDYIPVFRFVDEKTLQPIQAHQRSGAATVPQWFRKAVEAEKLRLSLPIVEMSEFNDIVKFLRHVRKPSAWHSFPRVPPCLQVATISFFHSSVRAGQKN